MKLDDTNKRKYSLIITIVRKGLGSHVIDISKNSGAEGGTIVLGKGIAEENVYQEFLELDFNPEKEIILTLVQQDNADKIIDAISSEAELDKPGNGIAFIIDVKNHLGITHLLEKWAGQKGGSFNG
ncbi:MAG: P-II family nitrogen regulator [Tissierellales bacterium]